MAIQQKKTSNCREGQMLVTTKSQAKEISYSTNVVILFPSCKIFAEVIRRQRMFLYHTPVPVSFPPQKLLPAA